MSRTQELFKDETIGEVFKIPKPFMVKLDIYTDGWFVEWAVYHEDESKMNWSKAHDQPLTQAGENSKVIIIGAEGLVFRLNYGTVGATAYTFDVDIGIFK